MTQTEITTELLKLCKTQTNIQYPIPKPYPEGYTVNIDTTVVPNALSLCKGAVMVADVTAYPDLDMDLEYALGYLFGEMENGWTQEEFSCIIKNMPKLDGPILTEAYLGYPAGTNMDSLLSMYDVAEYTLTEATTTPHELTILLEKRSNRSIPKDPFTVDVAFDNGVMGSFCFLPKDAKCLAVFSGETKESCAGDLTACNNEQIFTSHYHGELYTIHLAITGSLRKHIKDAIKRKDPAVECGELHFESSHTHPIPCLIMSGSVIYDEVC